MLYRHDNHTCCMPAFALGPFSPALMYVLCVWYASREDGRAFSFVISFAKDPPDAKAAPCSWPPVAVGDWIFRRRGLVHGFDLRLYGLTVFLLASFAATFVAVPEYEQQDCV